MISARIRNNFPFLIFYAALFITGILIYRNYGISWDELACRFDQGMLNWRFITEGKYQALWNDLAKFHGPVFELFLISIERLFKITDEQTVYFMRHLFTFLLFFISVYFFYRICKDYLKSQWLALLGCIFLILSPRLFSDFFYNTKDLAFMSLIIINIYYALLFLKSRSVKTALYLAVISGIVIDVRIMGVMVPCFVFLVLFIDFIRQPVQRGKIILWSSFILVVMTGIVILFWPVMWRNPFENLFLAWKEFTKFPWEGGVFYFGKNESPSNLPWHYIPVWIAITTPILYLLLFFTGLVFLLRRFIENRNLMLIEWLSLIIFFGSISSVIILKSVLYDAWRHLYYIYPAFIIIVLAGVNGLYKKFSTDRTRTAILSGGITAYCIYILITMISLHPYEHLYFNKLAGSSLASAREKFEMDYWGLSYREGIEYILKNDSSENIMIFPGEMQPAFNNIQILTAGERGRIVLTHQVELGDYFITSFRNKRDLLPIPSDFNVVRDSGIILSVYDIREWSKKFLSDDCRTFQYENNFEEEVKYENEWKLSEEDGNRILLVDSIFEYGPQCLIDLPVEAFKENTINYVTMEIDLRSDLETKPYMVIQIDSAESKTYFWEKFPVQPAANNEWRKYKCKVKLPKLSSSHKVLKVYSWNPLRGKFYIDNFRVDIFSIPVERIRNVNISILNE